MVAPFCVLKPRFIDEGLEALRGYITCKRSHGFSASDLGLEPRSGVSEARAFSTVVLASLALDFPKKTRDPLFCGSDLSLLGLKALLLLPASWALWIGGVPG